MIYADLCLNIKKHRILRPDLGGAAWTKEKEEVCRPAGRDSRKYKEDAQAAVPEGPGEDRRQTERLEIQICREQGAEAAVRDVEEGI